MYATYYQIQISTGGPQRLKLKKYIKIDNRLTTLKHRFLQTALIVQDGPMKVITVRDIPPYGHAPTYQLSLTKMLWSGQASLRRNGRRRRRRRSGSGRKKSD
jgi:hypothetical protein